MNKTNTLILSSLTALLLSAPAFANEPDTNQSVALMGSGQAPVVVNDSAIKKAIENLIKQQEKNVDMKKKIPVKLDNPVGSRPVRDTDRTLILGDAVPM